jgi:hypothetical protein
MYPSGFPDWGHDVASVTINNDQVFLNGELAQPMSYFRSMIRAIMGSLAAAVEKSREEGNDSDYILDSLDNIFQVCSEPPEDDEDPNAPIDTLRLILTLF